MKPRLARRIFVVIVGVGGTWASIAWGQTAGAVPDGSWEQLWKAAQAAGPFGTVFSTIMWWLERTERKSLQGVLYGERGDSGLVKSFMVAFGEVKDAIKDLQALFNHGKQ